LASRRRFAAALFRIEASVILTFLLSARCCRLALHFHRSAFCRLLAALGFHDVMRVIAYFSFDYAILEIRLASFYANVLTLLAAM